MSTNSTKGISSHSSQSESLFERILPQAQTTTLSEFQSEVDGLVGSAISTASDGKTMASLFAVGVAGRFIRLGAVAASGKCLAPIAAEGLSHGAALAGESALFAGMERKFAQMEGHLSTQSFQKDWVRAAINLGSIKFLGGAGRGQNFLTQHLLIDTGMVGAHNLGYTLGVTAKPQGGLARQMIQAEGMNLGMKGSLTLLHEFSPNLSAMEMSLDLLIKSRESSRRNGRQVSHPFLRFMLAAEGAPRGTFADFGKEREAKGPEIVKISGKTGVGGFGETRPEAVPGMVKIPGGKFLMGSKVAEMAPPVREVEVSPFFLSKTHVTNGEYKRYVEARQKEPFILLETRHDKTGETRVVDMGQYPETVLPRFLRHEIFRWDRSSPLIRGGLTLLKVKEPHVLEGFERPNQPVTYVNWFEAVAYAAFIVKGGRLPTEAEWEYAARGPQGFEYGTRSGKYLETEIRVTLKETTDDVGSYPANAYGLYDMSGNVWEWIGDWYQDSYEGLPHQNPIGPAYGTQRVLRGGSWASRARDHLTAVYRSAWEPYVASPEWGFRVGAPIPSDSKE